MSNRFQSAQEISKIYHAFSEREVLQGYFLQSAMSLLNARSAAIYWLGQQGKLWLESSEGLAEQLLPRMMSIAEGVQISGKPFLHKQLMGIPLIVRSVCIGVFCLQSTGRDFNAEDCDLVSALATEFASASKGIQLLEENVRMARLAAMGQTLSMVVHELKNILQLARLAEEMLQIGVRESKTKFIEQGSQKVRKALKEMDGFIFEMLSLARDQKLEAVPYSFKELAEELIEDLHVKTTSSNAILKIEIPDSFPTVSGDRKSIYRALLNLIKNAYEAKKGESITVTLSAEILDADRFRITVADNGSGMNEETRARLFQAFYTTKGERGTGLGLLVVDKTIKVHSGQIEVVSALGKGTRFIMTLPRNPVGSILQKLATLPS